jgi:hypothetical protein
LNTCTDHSAVRQRARDSIAFSARTQEGSTPTQVEVKAGEYFFQSPDEIPAGLTRFHLESVGREGHVMWVIRLRPKENIPQLVADLDADRAAAWSRSLGGPVAAAPGKAVTATLWLEPGEYLVLCYFHAPDGRSHSTKGMIRTLTATTSQRNGPAAAPDIVVTLRDYQIVLAGALRAGRKSMLVENVGSHPHEVIIIRLLRDVPLVEALKGEPGTVEDAGGVGILPPGGRVLLSLELQPGPYVWACFLTNEGDSKSHLEYGMARIVRVGGE